MAQIRISIVDRIGRKKTVVEVPDDVPVNQLMTVLVSNMNLPVYQNLNPISYRLDNPATTEPLADEATLAENGIESGAILSLVPRLQPSSSPNLLPDTSRIKNMNDFNFEKIKNIEIMSQPRPVIQSYIEKKKKELSPKSIKEELDSILKIYQRGYSNSLQKEFINKAASDSFFIDIMQGLDSSDFSRLPSTEESRPTQDELSNHLRQLYRRIAALEDIVQKQRKMLRQCQELTDTLIKVRTRQPLLPESPESEPYESGSSFIDYINFDIIFSELPSKYSATAVWFDNGDKLDATIEFQIPITLGELEVDYLRNIGLVSRSGSRTSELFRKLGQLLFETLFAGPIRDCFRKCQAQAKAIGARVRIRLDFRNALQLTNYPWEFLWNEQDFRVDILYTPIIRYFPRTRLAQVSTVKSPLKMLVVIASPTGWQPLNVKKEQENLTQALAGLVRAKLLQIEWLDHATPTTLRQALKRNSDLHILHYIGHSGISEQWGGYLVLEREVENNEIIVMDGQRLSVMLRYCPQLKLVTLNTCRGARATAHDPFASIAIELVRTHVPAVVAMQHEIDEQTAMHFSNVFYRYLAASGSVYIAMSEARQALSSNQVSGIEWAIPALYSRSPDGVIFNHAKADES